MESGGCLCKAIRYRVSGDPVASVICAPTLSYESSPGVVRKLCGLCGSPISYESAESPGTIDLTTLSLDDPTTFPPTAEVWLEDRVPWEAVNPALEQYRRGSVGES